VILHVKGESCRQSISMDFGGDGKCPIEWQFNQIIFLTLF
jgi:hypothetical protein